MPNKICGYQSVPEIPSPEDMILVGFWSSPGCKSPLMRAQQLSELAAVSHFHHWDYDFIFQAFD